MGRLQIACRPRLRPPRAYRPLPQRPPSSPASEPSPLGRRPRANATPALTPPPNFPLPLSSRNRARGKSHRPPGIRAGPECAVFADKQGTGPGPRIGDRQGRQSQNLVRYGASSSLGIKVSSSQVHIPRGWCVQGSGGARNKTRRNGPRGPGISGKRRRTSNWGRCGRTCSGLPGTGRWE